MRREAVAAMDFVMRRKPARPGLRPARTEDYGFARQLAFSALREQVDQAVGWNEYRMDMNFARQWTLSECHVITLGQRDIGWMQLRPGRAADSLLNLFILPAYRNGGIGTWILRRLLAKAENQGKALTLSVVKQNRALGFYRRHGFTVTEEGPHEFTMRFEPRRSTRGVGPSMGLRRG